MQSKERLKMLCSKNYCDQCGDADGLDKEGTK